MSRGKYSAPRTSPTPSRARNVPTTDWQRSRDRWSRQGKKAPFFGCSTPFLWASTKEMGSNRRAGQRPPSKVSAHTYKAKTRRPRHCTFCVCADTLGGCRCLALPFDPISLVLAQRNGVEPPKKSAFLPRRLHHSRERSCLGCLYSSSPDLGRGWVVDRAKSA